LNGLKNKHRSGRPPEVSEEATAKIRKELSENQSGWMAKEVMNLIYERTGVKYHEVIMKFISTDYYIDGVSVLRYQK
jgi:transposase